MFGKLISKSDGKIRDIDIKNMTARYPTKNIVPN